ncbi:MAG: hypothetical protein JXR96_24750 [Deltaproteobacteria bacterium]|nr:hypothetical protein [Deltaproteobacteria bacterium]
MQALVGIHVGLEQATTLVADPDGRIVSLARAAIPTHRPEPGKVEQEPDDWWRAVASTCRQALKDADVSDFAGVGLASQPNCVVAVDSRGHPLGRALIATDRRAAAVAADLLTRFEPLDVQRRTGSRISATQATIKMAWASRHWDLFQRCRQALSAGGFVGQRLTGRSFLDRTQASVSGFLDVHSRQYAVDHLQALGVPAGKLPSLVDPFEKVGRITSAAAADTGLRAGLWLAGGLSEPAACALAAGLAEPGQALVLPGGELLVCSAHPVADAQARTYTCLHTLPQRWLVVADGEAPIAEQLDWLTAAGAPARELALFGKDALDEAELADCARRGLGLQVLDIEAPEALGAALAAG